MSFLEPSEIQLGWFSHCFVNHGSKWLHLKHSWKATAWPCNDLAGLAKAIECVLKCIHVLVENYCCEI